MQWAFCGLFVVLALVLFLQSESDINYGPKYVTDLGRIYP